MALIKEPYGLVYNTDGTLCTTYRDDVVPFRGVRSFAVETATTNFLGPYAWEFDSEKALFYPSWLASGKTWADCWDASQRAYVGGHGLTTYSLRTKAIDLGSTQAAGTKVTLSWKHKGYFWFIAFSYGLTTDSLTSFKPPNTYEIKGDASFDYWEGQGGLHLKINGVRTRFDGSPQRLLDRWYDVEITYTLPADARYVKVEFDFYQAYRADGGRGVKGYIHKPQLEIKPFASSFVNGSRPKGRLVISVEDLMFDIANDDWVISYWKYPVATRDDTQNHYNRYSLGQWTSDRSKGFIRWGKEDNKNKYKLLVVLNDATTFENISDNTFNSTDYFYHWHYEVVKKSGKVLSYYVDGVKQCELIIPADKELQTPFDVGLNLGGFTYNNIFYPENALIAALYYGYNSATWTDEYIREVYEAKIPFAVQNQLSIY